jgi:hypothetical protein
LIAFLTPHVVATDAQMAARTAAAQATLDGGQRDLTRRGRHANRHE